MRLLLRSLGGAGIRVQALSSRRAVALDGICRFITLAL
jgi:hypothetical protein